MIVAIAQCCIQIVKRLAGPEHIFEPIHRTLCARIEEAFVDDNAPAPDGSRHQSEHDKFHDKVGLPEHAPKREIMADRIHPSRYDVARFHNPSIRCCLTPSSGRRDLSFRFRGRIGVTRDSGKKRARRRIVSRRAFRKRVKTLSRLKEGYGRLSKG